MLSLLEAIMGIKNLPNFSFFLKINMSMLLVTKIGTRLKYDLQFKYYLQHAVRNEKFKNIIFNN